jgi:hypothetical protein
MSMIIIDPEGDFDEERLLVSSKVLSLVSPVFAAMFKPQFKEGIRSHLTSDEPSIIPLPEDDAKIFILFCKVIHHRSDEIPQQLGISYFGNLAFICNKYQCTGVITNCSILWLQKLIRAVSPEDLNRLLLVAYILNLPESFSIILREIVQLQFQKPKGRSLSRLYRDWTKIKGGREMPHFSSLGDLACWRLIYVSRA